MGKRELSLTALLVAGVAVIAWWLLSRGKAGHPAFVGMGALKAKLAKFLEPGETSWEARARRFATDILSEETDRADSGSQAAGAASPQDDAVTLEEVGQWLKRFRKAAQ